MCASLSTTWYWLSPPFPSTCLRWWQHLSMSYSSQCHCSLPQHSDVEVGHNPCEGTGVDSNTDSEGWMRWMMVHPDGAMTMCQERQQQGDHDYNGTQAVGISIAVYCQKCSTTDCQLALETTYNPYPLCKTHQPPRPKTRTWENPYPWYWQQVEVKVALVNPRVTRANH